MKLPSFLTPNNQFCFKTTQPAILPYPIVVLVCCAYYTKLDVFDATLWQSNIATENPPFVYGGFSHFNARSVRFPSQPCLITGG
jgi:hypothetical protein